MAEDKGNIYAPPEVRVDDVRAEGDIELASRLSRLGAAIVDGLIIGVPFYLIVFVVFGNPFGLAEQAPTGIMSEFALSLALFFAAFALYAAINWAPLQAHGQTWGKKLLNIRIVRTDGSPVGARRALFIRYLPVQAASMIPFIGTLFWLVNTLLIFRESRKCLHDDIADTVVVRA